ncbi:MAG: hypothetical protein V1661_00605, partial [bacterium]
NLFPYFLAYSCGHILACVLISKFGLLYLNPLPNYMEDRVRISGRIPVMCSANSEQDVVKFQSVFGERA